MALSVNYYSGNEKEWDNFVLHKAMNGTFLQTRKFINYHAPDKFKDCSLCIRKGEDLKAVVLGCCIDDNGKTFFAHKGSTFGGITIAKDIYSASMIDELFQQMEEFLKTEGFIKIYLKMVPSVYQKECTDLLDYFLYKYGYNSYSELNYYMHLNRYMENVASQFSASKRRDYKYSLKNGLVFHELKTREEIAEYFQVLQMNLKKLNLPSVHSLPELYDLKFNRFQDEVLFYGVFYDSKIIAGSMIFIFNHSVFHTQYLSSDENYLKMYPMDFLITNLLQTAVEKAMRLFTFGICTENQGKYLNLGLSRFKEGFGTEFCINRSYEKNLLPFVCHAEDA